MRCHECGRGSQAYQPTCPYCGASLAAEQLRVSLAKDEAVATTGWRAADHVSAWLGAALFDVVFVAPLGEGGPLAAANVALSLAIAYGLGTVLRRVKRRNTGCA